MEATVADKWRRCREAVVVVADKRRRCREAVVVVYRSDRLPGRRA